jgi:hypothetical protein
MIACLENGKGNWKGEVLNDTHSFYGEWNGDVARFFCFDQKKDQPTVQLIVQRAIAFYKGLACRFAHTSGVYIGECIKRRTGKRLYDHLTKAGEGEAIVMVALHTFPTQKEAKLAEKDVQHALWAAQCPLYENLNDQDGSSSTRDGESVVYALLVVGSRLIVPPLDDTRA